jgi:hypothetical protein
MRSPVADLLADLDAALMAVHVEWFLFGAHAAILYGVALESALGQSDLLPAFDRALARAK